MVFRRGAAAGLLIACLLVLLLPSSEAAACGRHQTSQHLNPHADQSHADHQAADAADAESGNDPDTPSGRHHDQCASLHCCLGIPPAVIAPHHLAAPTPTRIDVLSQPGSIDSGLDPPVPRIELV